MYLLRKQRKLALNPPEEDAGCVLEDEFAGLDLAQQETVARLYASYRTRTDALATMCRTVSRLQEQSNDLQTANAHLKHQLAQLSIELEEQQQRAATPNSPHDSAYGSLYPWSECDSPSLRPKSRPGTGQDHDHDRDQDQDQDHCRPGLQVHDHEHRETWQLQVENESLRQDVDRLSKAIEESLRVLTIF